MIEKGENEAEEMNTKYEDHKKVVRD